MRLRGAGGGPLAHAGSKLALFSSLALWLTADSTSPGQQEHRSAGPGCAREGVPFDGGIGGEMTSFEAAGPKQALALSPSAPVHAARSLEWWLGAIPVCIKPVRGARIVIEAARAARARERQPASVQSGSGTARCQPPQTRRFERCAAIAPFTLLAVSCPPQSKTAALLQRLDRHANHAVYPACAMVLRVPIPHAPTLTHH